MKLTTAHKITIGSSVAFSALFSGWSFTQYAQDSAPGTLAFACFSAVASAVLLGYLIRFSRTNPPKDSTKNTEMDTQKSTS